MKIELSHEQILNVYTVVEFYRRLTTAHGRVFTFKWTVHDLPNKTGIATNLSNLCFANFILDISNESIILFK